MTSRHEQAYNNGRKVVGEVRLRPICHILVNPAKVGLGVSDWPDAGGGPDQYPVEYLGQAHR
ncbi:MAG: hypothetical protein KAZ88_08830 [Acidimicrobiia bacterium]|jgi:hypothetical protein|nr:hypothetical protein [Acidimicrobiia bacterium]MBP8181082.1 hypothetical protein [Acidimicrobiia bacterium]